MEYTQQDRLSFFRRAFLRHQPQRYAVMQPAEADRKYSEYRGNLSDTQIAAHLAGRSAYAIPYIHNQRGNVLALDIDAGAPAAVLALLRLCDQRGLWAFAQYDEQAGRGYVYIPFDDQAELARIKTLGDDLIGQAQREGWQIDNRATEADTRLPLARHRRTGRRGTLLVNGAQLDMDMDIDMALDELMSAYQENPTSQLPTPPAPKQASKPAARRPTGKGYSIQDFNRDHDLIDLLEQYGATRAKGQGRLTYFCPCHDDRNASLTVYTNRRGVTVCHCMSQHSNCPLAARHGDAFYLYCMREGLTEQQALRRLNGLPDDPDPQTGPQTPPAAPGIRQPPRSGTETPPEQQSAPQRALQRATQRPAATPEARTAIETTISAHARKDRQLRPSARALLEALFSLMDNTGRVWLSVEQYAEAAGISERSARYALRQLEDAGYLLRERDRSREGQTNAYALVLPSREGGQKVAPTCSTRSCSPVESHEARRGGQADPAPAPQASAPKRADPPQAPEEARPAELVQLAAPEVWQASTEPDATGCYRGPAGAVAYASGVAYVPPEAEAWYRELVERGAIQIPQPPTPIIEPELPPEPEPPPVRYGPPRDEATRRRYFALLGKAKKATSPKQRLYLQGQARLLEEPLPARAEPTRPPAPPPARPGRRTPEPAQLGMFDQGEAGPQRRPFRPDEPPGSRQRWGQTRGGPVAPPSSSYRVESA